MRALTINGGSSSVKFALYALGDTQSDGAGAPAPERLLARGAVTNIGAPTGAFVANVTSDTESAQGGGGDDAERETREAGVFGDHAEALARILRWLDAGGDALRVEAVGHRIVHGGPSFAQPQRVTPQLLAALDALRPLAPDHLPSELAALRAALQWRPNLPQVVCFDTAFHRSRPAVARRYALPRDLSDAGILRYGFHGLSCEYIIGELGRQAGEEAARGRVVIAHLGAGASMTATRDGRSVETTMGFTPVSGLVMATRVGDLDPGALLYLVRERGLSPDAVDTLINRQSGLLGVSGRSSDMRDLLAARASDPHAAEAVALFLYTARKALAALTAPLGGLDTVVFTGGIGEHAAEARAGICEGLDYLGLHIDPARNVQATPIISPDGAAVTVRVIPTNEELVVARHTRAVVSDGAP